MFSKAKPDCLQEAFTETVTIHISHSKPEPNGNQLFFIAVKRPTFCNSIEHVKANESALLNNCGNGLVEEWLCSPKRLCAERVTGEEPELIVDEQLLMSQQILEQHEQETKPPQAEEAQQPRPTCG